jgi:hypothetical protein
VDGVTLLEGPADLEAGTIVEVEIVDADDYDLRGSVQRIVRPTPGAPRDPPDSDGRRPRSLPVLPLGLEAAWGR